MPKFNVTFERRVVEWDYHTREIEADTIDQANEIAEALAAEFNGDCPSVDRTVSGECEDWGVEEIKAINP